MIEKYGVTIKMPEPFLQEDLETYQTALQAAGEVREMPVAVFEGAVVRTAIGLGWMTGILPGEVGKQAPWRVEWAASQVIQEVNKARELPPE